SAGISTMPGRRPSAGRPTPYSRHRSRNDGRSPFQKPILGCSMATLEELTKDAVVRGVLVDGQVTVLDARWHGSNVVELTYKDSADQHFTKLVDAGVTVTLEIQAS